MSPLKTDSKLDGTFRGMEILSSKREFVICHVEEKTPKRPMGKPTRNRKKTWNYHLSVNNNRVKVCQEMFLHMIAVSITFVCVALQKKNEDGKTQRDRRGKHVAGRRRIDEESKNHVREHIASFPTKEAHYVRKDSRRKYLDED